MEEDVTRRQSARRRDGPEAERRLRFPGFHYRANVVPLSRCCRRHARALRPLERSLRAAVWRRHLELDQPAVTPRLNRNVTTVTLEVHGLRYGEFLPSLSPGNRDRRGLSFFQSAAFRF